MNFNYNLKSIKVDLDLFIKQNGDKLQLLLKSLKSKMVM
jgi:hypothetical protein